MQTAWQGRLTQAASKYGEHAPAATVCCNACRTCATSNLITVALGVFTAVGAAVSRRFANPV
jgi:hypothetical protein